MCGGFIGREQHKRPFVHRIVTTVVFPVFFFPNLFFDRIRIKKTRLSRMRTVRQRRNATPSLFEFRRDGSIGRYAIMNEIIDGDVITDIIQRIGSN